MNKNKCLNVPDVANPDKSFIFNNLENELIEIESFILTHPKTGEKVVQFVFNTNSFYLSAKDTAKVTQAFNELAMEALEYNMTDGAISVAKDTFRSLLARNVIEKVIFEYIGEHEETEYKKFRITPVFRTLFKPVGEKDYMFIDYILISPFYEEFAKQMEFYGGLSMIEFVNFNYEDYKGEVIDKYFGSNNN